MLIISMIRLSSLCHDANHSSKKSNMMDVPEETLEAVKKVVFDIFDNGKVKDVTLRLGYDSQGEDVIWVRLHVVPGDPEA